MVTAVALKTFTVVMPVEVTLTAGERLKFVPPFLSPTYYQHANMGDTPEVVANKHTQQECTLKDYVYETGFGPHMDSKKSLFVVRFDDGVEAKFPVDWFRRTGEMSRQ